MSFLKISPQKHKIIFVDNCTPNKAIFETITTIFIEIQLKFNFLESNEY